MAKEMMIEKWQGQVCTVSIGATKQDGGSRSHVIKVGGQNTLPFLFKEGDNPNKPVVAMEVWDTAPSDWPEELLKYYKDVAGDPVSWAQKCIKEYHANLLCLKLQGAHPDFGNKSPDQEAKLVGKLLREVPVPLIILGCGDDAKDNIMLPLCCEASKGERCLIGDAVQDNYKTLAAAVLADGHNIIAESPIDINIAKQLNILISDMGLPLDRIVINPTIGALGYGLEYAYSIMERSRLAALAGDKTVASPFICLVGQESWKAKEVKAQEAEFPNWGGASERGIAWEMVTATALLQAGADILVMRHPKAVEKIEKYISKLVKTA
ncbi:MAG: acetyl-CoA decarbonylase/synthase complex subunit delta [Candidatus Omnitrophota bacterium]|jgi:acetyl-CoA decarbonylase/synthase complex subunit delta|nr:MAG: acetyl-CoA decarbonylase/synthase complex subunit delta [Candidatus Omnitrophota bacterium]